MLEDAALARFLQIFAAAKSSATATPSAGHGLAIDQSGLYSAEVWRLSRSLQIASVLGDAPAEAAIMADRIARQAGDQRCVPLDDIAAWEAAILWAMNQDTIDPRFQNGQWYARQQQVGEACRRLRQQGYEVTVGAYGPDVSTKSRHAIQGKIDRLVSLVGGVETLSQICRVLKDQNLIHDGMWLFGDQVPGVSQTKFPTLPYGWLFSLGLKHAGRPSSPRKPAIAWKTLATLAIDYAASLDCQRYSQMEELNLHPSAFHRTLRDSLVWREVFTLPQVPAQVVTRIRAILRDELTLADQAQLGVRIDALFGEIEAVLAGSADDRPTVRPRETTERHLPTLWRLAKGTIGRVNPSYLDPLTASTNQDALILFERGQQQVLTLPRSMVAAAACETVFKLIWSKLERKRASDVVGKTFEKAIARACQGKAPLVVASRTYEVGKQSFELDAATREDNKIVLIETKAKSLTSKARLGDMFAFFSDYADSFLAMLEQLARHERHFSEGSSPLSETGDNIADIRLLKVAVSPLSYGPLSDKVLTGNALRALAMATLHAKNGDDPAAVKAVGKINAAVRSTVAEIALSAPRRDGLLDLHAYLIDVFWLDLGQVLYVLDRSHTAWDAFAPLKNITYSTRDFWTEVAFADRGYLTKDRWRPISDGSPLVVSRGGRE
jgi:hypothetical protein